MSDFNLLIVVVRSLLFALTVCLGSLPGMAFDLNRRTEESRLVCGPRCVQFVLDHYGQKVDLIDLIKEMQWPKLEEGMLA